jgi:hypothetical protein
MWILLVIIVVIIILYYMYTKKESYITCGKCPDPGTPIPQMTVLNPYQWPYSGTPCMDSLYNKENPRGTALDIPLTSQTTPDHTLLTS